MPRRKKYCEIGAAYCKQSSCHDGVCIKIVRERENERARRWFSENGWQYSILFMRGVRYSTEGHEIIRDARGILYNGRRLHTKEDIAESLANVLPEWLIDRVILKV